MTIDLTGDVFQYWTVNVQDMAKFVDPLLDDVWDTGMISKEEVLSCPDNTIGKNPSNLTATVNRTREYHIARISYLMEHGWEEVLNEEIMVYSPMNYFQNLAALKDDYSPKGIRERQRVRITDGNHRFCAALFTGVQTLDIEPYGDLSFLATVLNPVSALP